MVAEICVRSWVVEEWAYQTGGLKTLCFKIGHSEPSRLKEHSQTLVVSMIPVIRPRSWLSRWSQRSVQDLGCLGDQEDQSKISVRKVIAKIRPRSWSDQWFRRSFKISVKSVIAKIRSSSWLDQRPRKSLQDIACLCDLDDQSKISVKSVIAEIHPRYWLSWWSRGSTQFLG